MKGKFCVIGDDDKYLDVTEKRGRWSKYSSPVFVGRLQVSDTPILDAFFGERDPIRREREYRDYGERLS